MGRSGGRAESGLEQLDSDRLRAANREASPRAGPTGESTHLRQGKVHFSTHTHEGGRGKGPEQPSRPHAQSQPRAFNVQGPVRARTLLCASDADSCSSRSSASAVDSFAALVARASSCGASCPAQLPSYVLNTPTSGREYGIVQRLRSTA